MIKSRTCSVKRPKFKSHEFIFCALLFVPPMVVRSSADAMMEILKGDEHSKDFDRKREIDHILGDPMPNNELNLRKKIHDWDRR